MSTGEVVRLVQRRRIKNASVRAGDKLVGEMCPVMERQSGPAIGTVVVRHIDH